VTTDGNGLRASMRGAVITPTDPGYDEARAVWNAMIDRRPAVIIRCAGAADVISAVNYARDAKLPLSVRGGGHSIAGHATCDDGVVIDLAAMKSIRVDPLSRTARAEPGVRWGEFDRETQAFGLAVTGGTDGDTGIAGLTLGGGFGWLCRKYGLTIDNLLSADVVLASGELVKASAAENADLFWALRGGSGNFGVVTSFEYRLHPVGPMITGGMALHPLAAARDALRFYREFARAAPDELTTAAALLTGPDGSKMVALIVAHCGSLADGAKAVAPVKAFGKPAMDVIGPMPYAAQQALFKEGFPPHILNYWKGDTVREIGDGLIDTVVSHFEKAPSPRSAVLWFPLDGAAGRVPPDATAYPHRGLVHLGFYSLWTEASENEPNIAWAREGFEAIRPFSAGGVYVNELGMDESDDRIRGAYGSNYARLAQLKAKYDPQNLFRLNANIRPA
jgi:FAD/FMN-containing dehydrogenase